MGYATDSKCSKSLEKRDVKEDHITGKSLKPSSRYYKQGEHIFLIKLHLGKRYEGRSLWTQAEISLIHVKGVCWKIG